MKSIWFIFFGILPLFSHLRLLTIVFHSCHHGMLVSLLYNVHSWRCMSVSVCPRTPYIYARRGDCEAFDCEPIFQERKRKKEREKKKWLHYELVIYVLKNMNYASFTLCAFIVFMSVALFTSQCCIVFQNKSFVEWFQAVFKA